MSYNVDPDQTNIIKCVIYCCAQGHVAQSVAHPTADPGVVNLARSIPFMVILLPQIKEGLLSVTIESMCTKNWTTGYLLISRACPGKSVVTGKLTIST